MATSKSGQEIDRQNAALSKLNANLGRDVPGELATDVFRLLPKGTAVNPGRRAGRSGTGGRSRTLRLVKE